MSSYPPSLNRVITAIAHTGLIEEYEIIGLDDGPRRDGSWQINMPAFCHGGDGETAMSITYRDEATYLKCHSHQCPQSQILDVLNLRSGDLFDVRAGEGNDPLAINNKSSDSKHMRDFLYSRDELEMIEPPTPIIDGWLFKQSSVWISGAPKSGKTLVGIDMAYCIGTGIDWNWQKTLHGPVLYVAAEGMAGVRGRVSALEEKYGQKMANVYTLNYAPQLLDESNVSELLDIIQELNPLAVFLDTQARMTVGVDENDAKDMGRAIASADRLKKEGDTAVILLHHIVKAKEDSKVHMKDIRGSGAIAGAADTMIGVHRHDHTVSTYVIVHKEAENPKQADFTFASAAGSVYLAGEMDASPQDRQDRLVAEKLSEIEESGMVGKISEKRARESGVSGTGVVLREALKIWNERNRG